MPGPEPGGWIYFKPDIELYVIPARVNVRTGAVEQLVLPPPFHAASDFYYVDGFVSPINGNLAGAARFGGLFHETFVLDAATGQVNHYLDTGNQFGVSVDSRHRWAPDGSAIAFTRHQVSGCCRVWVRLNVATGVVDTLESDSERTPQSFFWFGPDTLVFQRADAETPYASFALATGAVASWNLVPYTSFRPPTVSRDRRWIAYWTSRDSVVEGGGTVRFAYQNLLDRRTQESHVLATSPYSDGTMMPAESFDPDSKYVAHCVTFTTIRIRELATGRNVKDLEVPFCFALVWSWGPEGKPQS